MNAWYGISEVIGEMTRMGIAFGIVGYFIFREWGRRRENLAMMERMTPEQLADIRRVDAEIEIERKRRSGGNLRFLRLGMTVFGGGLGLLVGLECFGCEMFALKGYSASPVCVFKIIATTVLGMGLFIFLEFLIELWFKRADERRRTPERE